MKWVCFSKLVGLSEKTVGGTKQALCRPPEISIGRGGVGGARIARSWLCGTRKDWRGRSSRPLWVVLTGSLWPRAGSGSAAQLQMGEEERPAVRTALTS